MQHIDNVRFQNTHFGNDQELAELEGKPMCPPCCTRVVISATYSIENRSILDRLVDLIHQKVHQFIDCRRIGSQALRDQGVVAKLSQVLTDAG